MNLTEIMSSGQSYKQIHVDEIRVNPVNFYREEEDEHFYVNSMAELIQKDGMDANGIVYLDQSIDDGKSYTLLSGERRFKAVQKNYENDLCDGLFYAKVVTKPQNETEEMLRIISANNHRNKSPELRRKEVKALEMCWNELKARGEKIQGKKREWIAEKIGLSPRMVQNYLKDEPKEEPSNTEQEDSEASQEEDDVKTAKEELKEKYKAISKRAKEIYDMDIKITEKSVALKFDGQEELREVLSKLGLEDLISE